MTNPFIRWIIFFVVVVGIFLSYISTSTTIGNGDAIMPLDDAYIHFQYAKQLANGEPYIYNLGDESTSGATSFIYPYVLAIGYIVGFKGFSLGIWAMGIGAITLLASTELIHRLAETANAPDWVAILGAITFALTGAISWHYMSGMETGLITTFVLATLYAFITKQFRPFLVATTLLALSRPEGSIMTAIAILLYGWEQRKSLGMKQFAWLLVPFMAILVQPMLNLILTGSVNAAGSQAKSILSTVPFYFDNVVNRIQSNFTHMLKAFATGDKGLYTPYFIAPLALIGLIKQRSFTGLLLVGWFLTTMMIISTLDTAFWHFRRYQIPLIALLYPLAIWGIVAIWEWLSFSQNKIEKTTTHVATLTLAAVICTVFTLPTWMEFYRLYKVNIQNIAAQPMPMALWLKENTPEDSIVAVHDVGMMRYIGERKTLDLVGLTTANAANAWRNGPGAVAEFIMAQEHPPNYIAAYTTARGLNYLEATSLYGELLAGFTAEYDPADNVALGAEFQGIYTNDMTTEPVFYQPIWTNNLADTVNVANLISESEHHYQWQMSKESTGFVTEVYEMDYIDCTSISRCTVLDGGRRINVEESFILNTIPNQDGLLVTRIHPSTTGTIDIYVDGRQVDTQWIPFIPGQWLDIITYIPADVVTNEQIAIEIIPNTPDGFYMPYHHWLWQGDYPEPETIDTTLSPIATFQDDAFTLYADYAIDDTSKLTIDVVYEITGQTYGDYKIFAHIYDNIDEAPLAQFDMYPNKGTLPVGNWLQGTLSDTISVNLDDFSAGIYQIALGFYNPHTFERLSSNNVRVEEQDARLIIGQIEISDEG